MNFLELSGLWHGNDWITHQECEWRRNSNGYSECTCGATALIGAIPVLLRLAVATSELEAAKQAYAAALVWNGPLDRAAFKIYDRAADAIQARVFVAEAAHRAAVAALREMEAGK